MHPELAYNCAELDQLALELADLGVGALPLVVAREALDALDQHAPVPRAVEDADIAARWQPPPEAVEIMVRFVVALRRSNRMDHIAARVELLGDALDRPAFPGSVPALEHQHDRALLQVHLYPQQVDFGLQ